MLSPRFARYAWFIVIYNLGVVAFGAFVRATGSGAGCGEHWPLCNGVVVPRAEQIETVIEFTHRFTSGLDGLFVIGLVVWAVRALPRGHSARRWAWITLALVIVEGGLGAGLVKYQLVADDQSMARGLAMAAHLVNTFLLLAAAALTAWFASGGGRPRIAGRLALIYGGCLVGTILLGVSGAITALGDTLFPAASLADGLAMDFAPGAHLFVRLRVFHPAIAVVMALALWAAAWRTLDARPAAGRFARILSAAVATQIGLGFLNVALAAPVWLQLVHLLVADVVWLSLVIMSAAALAAEPVGRA